jgi:ubiquinone/menaquinone biosynthesis C-methylase UbiE
VSNVYTHGHHESVLRSHRWRTAENSAGYLLPHLRPGMRVLDVGCGPGTITMDLAELVGPDGSVTALEVTDEALDLARAEAERRGTTNVDFVVGDATALDLPDGGAGSADGYDVVHAHQVLHHLGDPVQALREMARVCRPGGLVAARETDYEAFAWFPRLPELDRWLELYLQVARANQAEPAAGRQLFSWALAAGLRDVTPGSSTWCYAGDEDRTWWGSSWAERIVDSAIARQAVEGGFATRSELARLSEGWRRWSAAEDGWFSLLHGEVLCRV